MKKEKNQLFQILKAILIIMVIDDHTGRQIGILSSVFPYDSFFMPLFVFISGYFYKKESIIKNTVKKLKRLYIPYIVWSAAGLAVAFILTKAGLVNWYTHLTSGSLVKSLIFNPITSVNGAGWFVVMLFFVSVLYNVVFSVLWQNKICDYIFLILSTAVSMSSLYLCMNGANTRVIYTVIFRTLFYLPFFHIGKMFKEYWESYVAKFNKTVTCLVCIAVNLVLIWFFENNICFYSTSNMNKFHSFYLPFITFITGGLFWYTVCSALANRIKDNKIINFFADNTFSIMMSHLLFSTVPGFIVSLKVNAGKTYPWFDTAKFKSSAWFTYCSLPKYQLIAFFCALGGSTLLILLMNRIKKSIKNKKPQ